MIIKQLSVGELQANCYIVGCEETNKAVVIDPGAEGTRILNTAIQLGLKIEYVLITHAHFDHIAACKDVVTGTNAKLLMHENDALLLKNGGGAQFFGLPMPAHYEPDSYIDDGDTINYGKCSLKVLHTPGHSPGHVSFYDAENGVVFDGDVLFNGSIGRSDLPGGSFATLMNSIAEKLMTLPDETVVYSGHGTSTTIGEERVHNPFLR